MGKKGFKDLIVWQKAKDLAIKVYEASEEGDLNRDFGLRDQVRRSAVSIASNLGKEMNATQIKSLFDSFILQKDRWPSFGLKLRLLMRSVT
ncbi:MAG TPA: four helix bundle protein [Thermodesulfobacteriota bacterium]|nr:four helix bundle protein [Thermodesulfobacteriota bacterium]